MIEAGGGTLRDIGRNGERLKVLLKSGVCSFSQDTWIATLLECLLFNASPKVWSHDAAQQASCLFHFLRLERSKDLVLVLVDT